MIAEEKIKSQEIFLRASATCEKMKKSVCISIDDHISSMTPKNRTLWMSMLGSLGRFEEQMKDAMKNALKSQESDEVLSLRLERIELNLNKACEVLGAEMSQKDTYTITKQK